MKGNNPKVFIIGSQELMATRIDVSFHRPEFKQILKKIPFETLPLKKILKEDLKNGATPYGGKFLQEGVPFIRSQDYNIEEVRVKQYISVDFHEKLKRSVIRPNDILLSVVGATLGNVGIVRNEFKEGNINQNIVRIRIRDNVNPFYIAYFLYSDIGQKLLLRLSTITTQQYLNNEILENLPVPLPPIDIQNKIVVIMDKALKEKREKEKKAENLLNSIDKYLMQELGIALSEFKEKSPLAYVIGAKFLKHERWNTEYWKPIYRETEKAIRNGKYEVERLGKFIEEINYGASVKNIYSEDGIPLLRILNLKANEIDFRDLVKLPYEMKKDIGNSYVQEGDFLISRSGTIGIVAIVPKEANGFAFGSYMIRFKVRDDEINKFYLSAVLNSVIGRVQTQRNKIGAIQTNITIPIIKNLIIPLPPKSIQNKIANEIKARMEKAKELQKRGKQIVEKTKGKIKKIILGEEKI